MCNLPDHSEHVYHPSALYINVIGVSRGSSHRASGCCESRNAIIDKLKIQDSATNLLNLQSDTDALARIMRERLSVERLKECSARSYIDSRVMIGPCQLAACGWRLELQKGTSTGYIGFYLSTCRSTWLWRARHMIRPQPVASCETNNTDQLEDKYSGLIDAKYTRTSIPPLCFGLGFDVPLSSL